MIEEESVLSGWILEKIDMHFYLMYLSGFPCSEACQKHV